MSGSLDIFSYELPESKIAQRPVHPYDRAKLLVLNRSTGELSDSTFQQLPRWIEAGDLLIFNNTKVLPARLFGSVANTANDVELLLLTRIASGLWRCIGKPGKRLVPGAKLNFAAGVLGTIEERASDGALTVRFSVVDGDLAIDEALTQAGCMPVPPYIRRGHSDEQDLTDYQSLFARYEGSVAAPTASLHFTAELLGRVKAAGIETEQITLHVGAPSFLPILRSGEREIRPPGSESYISPRAVLDRIDSVRVAGKRSIAVGTTVVRALESMIREESMEDERRNDTALFITPGFKFKAISALITNFHQPRTTHLLLVEAFCGRELLERAYRHALEADYRFLSYGDGMLII